MRPGLSLKKAPATEGGLTWPKLTVSVAGVDYERTRAIFDGTIMQHRSQGPHLPVPPFLI
jgi:hypothetical protein